MYGAHCMCSQVNPEDRPSLEESKGLYWKKQRKKQLTIPLALSQTTTSETYDRKNVTAAFTLICLKIAEKVLELQPVSDAEIAGTFILTTLSTFH